MDQSTNDNFVQDIMSEPLIPTQLSLEDGYDDTITSGNFCGTFDDINDIGLDTNQEELDLDLNQDDLDEIVQDDINFVNDAAQEAKGSRSSLSVEEITHRLSKVPEHKMRCTINTTHITEEEARVLHNDCKGGNNKYFKSVCSTATKFFSIITTSTDPEINKYTQIVHDCNGYETVY